MCDVYVSACSDLVIGISKYPKETSVCEAMSLYGGLVVLQSTRLGLR